MNIIFRENLVTKEYCAARKAEVFHVQLCHSLHFLYYPEHFFVSGRQTARKTERQTDNVS